MQENINDEYGHLLIREYGHWSVYLHENQSYLGRCYAWCKRPDALDLSDATPEEQHELFQILRDMREALGRAFCADWMNYAFLGNEARHLHGHFIPRYASGRSFMGTSFTDSLWGRNYKSNKDFKVESEVLLGIRDALRGAMIPSYGARLPPRS